MLVQNMEGSVIRDQNIKQSPNVSLNIGEKLILKKEYFYQKGTQFQNLIDERPKKIRKARLSAKKGVNVLSKDLQNQNSSNSKILKVNKRKTRDLNMKWPNNLFYQSRWLTTLMNKMMKSGKKGLAEKILLSALTRINQKSHRNALILFHTAIEKLKPVLSIVLRRVGRRIYEVPVPVYDMKQYKIALRWLAEVTRKNSEVPAAESLANEILAVVFDQQCETLRKKEQLYDAVVRNRAYSHYRWV